MTKKVIFLCGVWTKEEEPAYIEKSKGGVQSAANALQTSIISGLDQICEQPSTLINEVFIGAYPKLYSDLFVAGGEYNHSPIQEHKDYKVEFLNLPYIKHLSRYYCSRKYIKKACNSGNGKMIIIGYSMTTSIVNGLFYAKKIKPDIKTCLIVPDLPEFMNMSSKKSRIFKLIKNLDKKRLYQKIRGIDGFVVLTEHMFPMLKVNKPHIVMEGIAATNAMPVKKENSKADDLRRIVYTGSLAKKYGVCELVDAFSTLDYDDIQLIICGNGDGVPYIEDAARKDKRIKYLGTVSHDEALDQQRKAYLLVNPRNSKEAYTKYSFPSKIMEYMATGNPIVMYKLDGIPEEYNDYIYFCDNNLQETLNAVLELPIEEVKHKGAAARQFVFTQKNELAQVRRILELVDII